jgi:WD40 repeat protein
MMRAYTRVAVVQLAYHPATLVKRRSPLSDPLFEPGRPDSLLPEAGDVPEILRPRIDALRRRVREAYGAQLLDRLRAILASLQALRVRIVVLPELSVPWELLGAIADAAGEMIVVAGSHTVERAAVRSGIYERLGASAESSLPPVGREVFPVLYRGRLLSIQHALGEMISSALGGDEGAMSELTTANTWAPTKMPAGVPGPMGVLPYLDFRSRDTLFFRKGLASALKACRFLALPSSLLSGAGGATSAANAPADGGAWEEARRFGRPVLHAAWAKSGGTSIFADEARLSDLRLFPDHAGHLERGDEGVIVADVDLSYERGTPSKRSGEERAVLPVAEATLVYRAHPVADAYAQWLEETAPLLDPDSEADPIDVLARVESARDLLLNAGALSGAKARDRRLRRMLDELDNMSRAEELRQFTREIVLPAGVLPAHALRAALARGAADEVFAWLKIADARAAGFGEVEARLRGESEKIVSEASSWTRAGMEAFGAVSRSVRGAPETEGTPPPPSVVRVFLPSSVDPAALGLKQAGGFTLDFRARPDEFRADLRRDTMDTVVMGPARTRGRVRSAELGAMGFDFSEAHLWVADELYLLAVGEGAERVSVVGVKPEKDVSRDGESFEAGVLLVLSSRARDDAHVGEGWVAREAGRSPWLIAKWVLVRAALAEAGIEDVDLEEIAAAEYPKRITALLPRYKGAREVIEALREQRLREVLGQFVAPDVIIAGTRGKQPIFDALDAWLASDEQTALILGEFGAGKSTSLCEWAHRLWAKEGAARPILVSLAAASRAMDPEGLLLEAARAEDTRKNRAALRLLIRRRLILPCFDGFDEMATRLEASDLAGRLSGLLEVGRGGGKVVVTSRDNYFPSEAELRTTAESALAQALGASAGLRRLSIQPFSEAQVRSLVMMIRGEARAAEEALAKIAQTYDLKDLVSRPLLLGMVLATLDQIEPGSKVGTADLYEAYLLRWLEQTRSGDPECFTDEQKVEFAEALAEQLWRSGRATCSWKELQESVRARLAQYLPHDVPPGAAFLEIQGGAFFVRDEGDRFRFAHKSFLEYFVARGVVFAAPERPKEVLTTKPITPEVAAFVGEILRRQGGVPRDSMAVRRVQAWLVGEVIESWISEGRDATSASASASARPDALSATAVPAANAARLLLELGRWAKDPGGWIPEGADLRGVRMAGEDLRSACFVRANLTDAHLSGADLRGADLTGARLDGARLNGVKLSHAVLRGASARRADFIQAEAHEADLTGAELSDAILRQSVWTACHFEGASAGGADVTGFTAPGCAGLLSEEHASLLSPSLYSASLTSGRSLRVFAVAWNPDGIRLAISGKHGMVRIWDPRTSHDVAHLYGHSRSVNAIAWHFDGIRLATASNDGTARVWSAATGEELVRIEARVPLIRLAWHPDGERLSAVGIDGTVLLFSSASGEELARHKLNVRDLSCAAWHPSGERLVCGGNDGILRVVEVATGAEITRMELSREIWAAHYNHDGKCLASMTTRGTIILWDVSNERELTERARLEMRDYATLGLHFDPIGARLAAGSHNAVHIWDTETLEELARVDLHEVVTVAWNPEGTQLAIGTSEEGTQIWDLGAGKEVFRAGEPPGVIKAVAFSADRGACASAGHDGVVRLWSAESGLEIARAEHGEGAKAIALDPDRKRFAGKSHDAVHISDIATGRELVRIKIEEGHAIDLLAWHPSGTYLAGAGPRQVIVWHAESGRAALSLNEGAYSIAWHPGSEQLAIATHSSAIRVTGLRKSAPEVLLKTSIERARAIAWSRDGKLLLLAGENGLEIQLPATGEKIRRMKEAGRSFQAAAWHPISTWVVAAAQSDGVVRIFHAGQPDPIAELTNPLDRAAWSLAYSGDGRRLAVAGDHGVHIWDAEANRLLCTFEALQKNTLARTAGGFCVFGGGDPDRYRLALRRPEAKSRSRVYLPLGSLRDILQRPEKVSAALSGDLEGDVLTAELDRLGYSNGTLWDGKRQRVQRAVAKREKEKAPPPKAPTPTLPVPAGLPAAGLGAAAAAGPAAVFASAAVAAPASAPASGPASASASAPAPVSARLLAPAPAPAPPLLEGRHVTLPPPAYEKRALQKAQQASTPIQIQNPFRPGPALTDAETLPGREAVINELLALIDSRSPAVLRGPRRAGKTSILHSIEKRLVAHERPVIRITLEASHIVTPDDLARVIDPALKNDPTPADALRARLRAWRRGSILLDEVANLKGADPSVFAWLRAVGQEEASVVFAGSFWDWVLVVERASAAPGSSFGNDVTPVNLGPIPKTDAVRFLVENAPPDVPIEEDRTARWILELCGTWPFYLQVMGHAVVQAVRAGSRAALVERPGVSELYEQKLLVDRDAVFRGRWAELPERARRILRPLPVSGQLPVQAARLPHYNDLPRDDRKILRDTGLCSPLGVWLDDPPFFDWIRRSADDHEGGSDSGNNVPR